MRYCRVPRHGYVVAVLVSVLCLGGIAVSAAAEPYAPKEGRLPNGLTYFIDPSKPADGKISFTLVVRVGDQEMLPREQSVAHVIEHIVHASAHVVDRKGSLRSRIERFGGIWGSDTNAATGMDSTSYYVKLPAANPAALGEGVDMLHDWAAPRPFSDEEIDRETKAVIEERRRGLSDSVLAWRAVQFHTWFPRHPFYDYQPDRSGTLSATPIGIRTLYGKWYTPPNMAVIVSGDLDPDAALAEIMRRFADVPRGAPSPARANPGTLPIEGGHYVPISIDGPFETRLQITYKFRPAPLGSPDRTREKAISLILDKVSQSVLGSFGEHYGAQTIGLGLRTEWLNEYPGIEMLTLGANIVPGGTRAGLTDLLRVAATLKREGFSEEAIERARRELIASLRFSERSNADRFETYFLRGAYEPSNEEIGEAAARLTAADVNAQLAKWLDSAHRDVFALHPKSDDGSAPDAAEFEDLARAAEQAASLRLAEPAIKEPAFIPFAPFAVKAKTATPEAEGYLRWKLPRSDATLLFRRTDSDRITVAMRRAGGLSRLHPAHAPVAAIAMQVVARSGLAGLDGFEFARFLDSRGIALRPTIGVDSEALHGSAPEQQWPLLRALLRAQLLQPLCRADAFEDIRREQLSGQNADAAVSGRQAFQSMITRALGSSYAIEDDQLRALDAANVCRQYPGLLGDTGKMVIAIEGNLDPANLYRDMASELDIPPAGRQVRGINVAPMVPTQSGRDIVRTGDSNSASIELLLRWRPGKDERAGILVASIMNQRISTRLRTVEKGTYFAGTSFDPQGAIFSVSFDTAPENVERMIAASKDELEKLRKDGVTADELSTARTQLKTAPLRATDAAKAWVTKGTLKPLHPVRDIEVRKWIAQHIRLAGLHEFVRLPSVE